MLPATPLPRWVGILSVFAALFGAANAATTFTFVSPTVGLVLVAVAVVCGALSTQLVGKGIPHGFGWFGAALAAFGALDTATLVPPGCVPTPAQLCEAVRLFSLFPPKVSAVMLVIGVLLKASARGPSDSTSMPAR